jgi:lysozyme family protein
MSTCFDKAFDILMTVEGGYVNDKYDLGGETKYGISKNSYPKVNIKELTLDEAKQIYKKDYWDRCSCDKITYPLNILLFDAAVNHGVLSASSLLQETLNVDVDGHIGANTIKAALKANSEISALFLTTRAAYYRSLSSFSRYGKGWMKRLFIISLAV